MKKNWQYVLTNNQLKLLILLFIGMVTIFLKSWDLHQ